MPISSNEAFEKAWSNGVDSSERIAPSLDDSVAWSWDLAHVHCTVKYFPKHVLHPKSTRKVILKIYMRDIAHLI